MPLTKCPDCGTDVSDRAPTCPKCGAPRPADAPPFAFSSKGRKTHPATWAGIIAAACGATYFSHQWNHEMALPTMPVAVQFRKAMLSNGYVLIVQNTSDKPLQVAARLSHPAINSGRRFDLFIEPHGHSEVSRFDGWVTQPGDRITLENSNFKPWTGSIPNT
jgi:hypothetical protein